MESDPGFLLVTRRTSTLYVSSLDNGLAGPGVRILSSFKEVKEAARKAGKLGFDDKNLSVLIYRNFRFPGWRPFSAELKALRMVKDRHEISLLRQAARETLKVYGSIVLEGRAELDVSADIHDTIRRSGYSPSFEPIVTSGTRSAFIHSTPTGYMITRGLVIVDMGMIRKGYCSDITRTYLFYPKPKEENLLNETQEMQSELLDMAVPGVKFSDIQKNYEKMMKKGGYPVMQSFGHGLGLSVHERPSRDDVLEKGMVITVEPGIYKKGLGGSRVEDMVLVSDKPIVLSR
jgi:Xaa-Pro aminopeptidase